MNWTIEDQRMANEDGWGVYWRSGKHPVIQKFGEFDDNESMESPCNLFESDDDAIRYVVAGALSQTDPRAVKAMGLLSEQKDLLGAQIIASIFCPECFSNPEEELPITNYADFPSTLVNTIIVERDGTSPLTPAPDGSIRVNMDGYLVVPKELVPPEVLAKFATKPKKKPTANKKPAKKK